MNLMLHAVLLIEYDGTAYYGWARQPSQNTIEGAIRDACARLDLHVHGLSVAGRTDRGVHASGQVVSLAYAGSVPVARLAAALAACLPRDISIMRVCTIDALFDARRDASWREYEYRVLDRTQHSPLRRYRVLHHPRRLSLDALNEAAATLVGQHDFTAFTPTETKHVFFHRTVYESHWKRQGDELIYTIRANAFLRNMVRICVGTMLAVGRGEWEVDRLRKLLEGAPRSEAHQTALPHALCLTRVGYAHDPFAGMHAGRSDG